MKTGTASEDERFLRAAVSTLEEYLRSPVLFWPIGGFSQPLTLGNLLLAEKKVAVLSNGTGEVADAGLVEKITAIKANLAAAWRQKANQELTSRIRQWQNIVNDLARHDPHGLGLSASARVRTLIELLVEEINFIAPSQSEQIFSLDERYRSSTDESTFIWDDLVQPAFPESQFWFLYRQLLRKE